eukprot:1585254-Amphidinium_carterae.1
MLLQTIGLHSIIVLVFLAFLSKQIIPAVVDPRLATQCFRARAQKVQKEQEVSESAESAVAILLSDVSRLLTKSDKIAAREALPHMNL